MLDMRRYLELLPLKLPQYYEGDRGLPEFARIASHRKRLFSLESTVKCLLHPQHSPQHLCTKAPTSVNHNVCFLVDCKALEDSGDIECDDMGVWRNNRVDTTQVLVLRDTNKVVKVSKVQKGTRQVQKMEAFSLKRVYRIHGTDQSFRKVTATIYGELFFIPN
jgi:hypothetical protein